MRALCLALLLTLPARAVPPTFANGPPAGDDYFPIAVWLQEPRNAPRYQAIGINLYVGLWAGPTAAQLAELDKHHMPVICGFDAQFADRKTIVGWMHNDEPDNAQELPKGQRGYGPPIRPEAIVADYDRLRKADPTRPVFLNLGQGVAFDNYIGRGVRRNKMDDYPQYARGADILSFDIYPVNHDAKEVAGRLEYVPRGVSRLTEWAGPDRAVWNCIETTPIDGRARPTPAQIRSEVWMSILAGSRGIVYFAHQFKPKFVEAGLLADPATAAGIARVNAEVRSLAPVIHSTDLIAGARATSSAADVPIALMTRRHAGRAYAFAAAMRDAKTAATLDLPGLPDGDAEVIGEGRRVPVRAGRLRDAFDAYAVHLYELPPAP